MQRQLIQNTTEFERSFRVRTQLSATLNASQPGLGQVSAYFDFKLDS